jgi:hypothetical protein
MKLKYFDFCVKTQHMLLIVLLLFFFFSWKKIKIWLWNLGFWNFLYHSLINRFVSNSTAAWMCTSAFHLFLATIPRSRESHFTLSCVLMGLAVALWLSYLCKFVSPKLLKGMGWNFKHLFSVIILHNGDRFHNSQLLFYRVMSLFLQSGFDNSRVRWLTNSSCLTSSFACSHPIDILSKLCVLKIQIFKGKNKQVSSKYFYFDKNNITGHTGVTMGFQKSGIQSLIKDVHIWRKSAYFLNIPRSIDTIVLM